MDKWEYQNKPCYLENRIVNGGLLYLALKIRKIEAALEYAILELTPPNAQSSVALLPLYELYMQ